VNEAIAYVQAHMRSSDKLPMCEIVDAHQSADCYGLSGHGYFVKVTARFIDDLGRTGLAHWQVWREWVGDAHVIYGEW
jgi:hypothetical protein